MALNKSYLIIAFFFVRMGNMHSPLGLLSVYLAQGPGCHAFSSKGFPPLLSLTTFSVWSLTSWWMPHCTWRAIRPGSTVEGVDVWEWECDFKRPIPAQKPSKGSFCSLWALAVCGRHHHSGSLAVGVGLAPCAIRFGFLWLSFEIFLCLFGFISLFGCSCRLS